MKDYLINTLPEIIAIPGICLSAINDNIWNLFGCIGGYSALVGLRYIRKSIKG